MKTVLEKESEGRSVLTPREFAVPAGRGLALLREFVMDVVQLIGLALVLTLLSGWAMGW